MVSEEPHGGVPAPHSRSLNTRQHPISGTCRLLATGLSSLSTVPAAQAHWAARSDGGRLELDSEAAVPAPVLPSAQHGAGLWGLPCQPALGLWLVPWLVAWSYGIRVDGVTLSSCLTSGLHGPPRLPGLPGGFSWVGPVPGHCSDLAESSCLDHESVLCSRLTLGRVTSPVLASEPGPLICLASPAGAGAHRI